MGFSSPAQIIGYVAFVLGVTAFLQKSDRRLKLLNAVQGVIYGLHFVLLGNLSASASSLISGTRSFLSLKTRSRVLATAIICVNVAAGAAFAKTGAAWLPVIASCAATIAMFTMQGIAMRLVLLCCTFMWLANNIVSGSIGGTMLELVIAVANGSTIVRMMKTADEPEAIPGLRRSRGV